MDVHRYHQHRYKHHYRRNHQHEHELHHYHHHQTRQHQQTAANIENSHDHPPTKMSWVAATARPRAKLATASSHDSRKRCRSRGAASVSGSLRPLNIILHGNQTTHIYLYVVVRSRRAGGGRASWEGMLVNSNPSLPDIYKEAYLPERTSDLLNI